jgi:hypothetical protein
MRCPIAGYVLRSLLITSAADPRILQLALKYTF